MTGDVSRTSAAIAASLAIHVAVLAILIGRGPRTLAIAPSPILLTLVDAAQRTAGPGQWSSQLRSPPPGAAPSAHTPAAAEASHAQKPSRERSQASVAESEAPKRLPAPVLRDKPRPAPKERTAVRKAEPAPNENVAPQKAEPAPPSVAAAAPAAPRSPATSDAAPGPATSAHATGTAMAMGAAGSGTGSDTRATAPAWAPAARVRYEELLYAWIDRHKQYPLLAQRRGIQGSGSVRVRIDRAGRVLERSLVRSTGEAMLDQAALDIVRRANPFPAVPKEYGGPSFEFVAPIEYRLH